MKHKIPFLFLFFIFSFINSNLYSQTVDEIIDKYAEAMGGADKLLSVNSLKLSGTIQGGGSDFPFIMILKRTGKARTEIDYQGMQFINACDGNTGWIINPFQGTRDAEMLPAERVKSLRKNSEIEGELINYREKGYKAEFLEKDDFEGSEVYKIKLTDNEGDVTYYFIDIDTDLLLMSKSKRKIGEKEITTEIVYGNYRKTNDIMFPLSYQIRNNGGDGNQNISFDKVEIDISVNDDIFKIPVTN
ncbi:MAG TPA: hypothetical protein PKA90_11265 [Ignavibacteria bacterium]|nr:hypothetical protein [Ignavibacteria bacterium]HMR40997.1 hypothetical protein [Ignavibacteria bacterium]